jgi:hypothetical protein
MKKTFAALALAAGASVANAQVGEKLPDLDVLQWFNSPPIAAEQLAGRAVLVEVFRTW